jgi:hypothetical protein
MGERELELLLNHVRSRFFGKYRGLVVDNNDSTNRGRLQVSVPSVLGEINVWAMPCVPYAGPNMGNYMMPDPGAGVWVEFEAGDTSYPIWTGGYWVTDELPHNEADTETSQSLKIIKTNSGLMITFDDDAEKLTLSDKDGSNMMTFEVPSGKIRIEAAIKVVVEAPQIELVENSMHPLVFGDDLLQYLNQMVQIFNTHLHPGELAAGVLPVTPMIAIPPMPPATPSLLSTKVKTG